MLNKPPLPFTKGLRLGNMPQIRTVVDEELESVGPARKPRSRRWIQRLSAVTSCCVVSSSQRSRNVLMPIDSGQ
nr:glycerol-3-phosphate ABC transporter [Raoultella sp. NCTC 9187]